MTKNLFAQTILGKIFGTRESNPVELDNWETGKLETEP